MSKQPRKKLEELRCAPPCNSLLGKYDPESDYFIQTKCSQRNCKSISNHGNHAPTSMGEFRCYAVDPKKSERAGHDVVCNKLLAKVSPETDLTTRCPRCGAFVNSQTATKQGK